MALGLGAFYAAWWPRLEALPELARARVAVHGGRWVPLSQVSPWFIRALIATEDQSFWTNWGVSFEGTARALVVDLKAGRFVQGGSTLTQQLVRDLYLSPRKTIPRKMTGILLALMAARLYSKTQILTAYINEVYLGAGAWGVAQASERYFGVAPSALTPAQATLLAGLPEAPSSLNPLRHLARAKARQREVLDSLLAVHWITPAEARAIWRAPLGLRRPAP
ncbi:MAG: transglycosylase domain-containing protein [Firmicutes bacterium]|nr:transglycosylase domain-containing protein [Alicyclobacillaceae bacterium]MCL6497884.1 transglycosylase domain-containing protein [Bacillota bacterium]